MVYTLKHLCNMYKKNSDNASACCNSRSEFLRVNKGNYHFEELNEEDIKDLRPYLQCDILAIYEYLAQLDKVNTQMWFSKYNDVVCPKELNDEYIELTLNPLAPDSADAIFSSMLVKSIEPFKTRGIPATCFDYTI